MPVSAHRSERAAHLPLTVSVRQRISKQIYAFYGNQPNILYKFGIFSFRRLFVPLQPHTLQSHEYCFSRICNIEQRLASLPAVVATRICFYRAFERGQIDPDKLPDGSQRFGQDLVEAGQNAAYQPFSDKRSVAFGRFAGLRLRPRRPRATRRAAHHDRGLRAAPCATDLSVCAGRQPARSTAHRPRIHGVVGRKRRAVCHRIYESRQAVARAHASQRGGVQNTAARNVGGVAAGVRNLVGTRRRARRVAGLHQRDKRRSAAGVKRRAAKKIWRYRFLCVTLSVRTEILSEPCNPTRYRP